MFKGGVMNHFIFGELDKNRKYYNHLSLEQFEDEVTISDDLIKAFNAYVQSINPHFQAFDYEGLLREYLKATMARQLFGIDEYERIISPKDPMIQKVLELDAAADDGDNP